MMINEDGNAFGRVAAFALLLAAGYGVHRINCGAGVCPVMKTDSCCTGADPAPGALDALRAAAAAPEAPAPRRLKAAVVEDTAAAAETTVAAVETAAAPAEASAAAPAETPAEAPAAVPDAAPPTAAVAE